AVSHPVEIQVGDELPGRVAPLIRGFDPCETLAEFCRLCLVELTSLVPRVRWFGRMQDVVRLVPSCAAARHCRLRFDVYPIDRGDLVRFREGRVSHIAYSGTRHTEILEFLPNGEL